MQIKKGIGRTKFINEIDRNNDDSQSTEDIIPDHKQVNDEQIRPVASDRIRLCVDISRAHHRKLKVYAAQQGIMLIDAVEQLVDRYCNIRMEGTP